MRYRIEVSGLIIVKPLDACPYLESEVPTFAQLSDSRSGVRRPRPSTKPVPELADGLSRLGSRDASEPDLAGTRPSVVGSICIRMLR